MSELNVMKRGNSWQYRFEAASIGGKRKQISKSGFRTKKEAERAGTKALAEYNETATIVTPSEMSVADLFDSWLENYVKVNLSESCVKNYGSAIKNHLKPTVGKYKVRSITTEILQNVVNRLYTEKNLAYSSMMIINAILKGVFNYARKTLKIILYSPAEDVMVPKLGPRDKRLRIHSIHEIERVLTYLMDKPHKYYAALIAYYTGMRISEVYALTWDDIDFEEGTIRVNKSLMKVSGPLPEDEKRKGFRSSTKPVWFFGPCKSESSYRTIAVGDRLLDELAEYRAEQEEHEKEYGESYKRYYIEDEEASSRRKASRIIQLRDGENPAGHRMIKPVFVMKDGTFNGTNMWGTENQRIEKSLGIEFSFHDLRHTHATLLIQNGASIKDIQTRLGHESAQTTLDLYTESTEKMRRESAYIFEKTSSIDTSTLRDPDAYRIWKNMVLRCRSATNRAKGITICPEWKASYESFFRWALANGYQKGAVLACRNENAGYNPENCYWMMPEEIGTKIS